MAGRRGKDTLKLERTLKNSAGGGLGVGQLSIFPKTTPNFSFVAYAFHMGYRYVALEGSSRSGKTYAALQWCVYACMSPKTFIKTYIRGELREFDGESIKIRCLRYDAVNARDSIWSDLNRIMVTAKIESGTAGFLKNETKMTWTFPNGSQIIVGGANDSGKLHGLEQDICYFNEVMMIPKSALDQLEYRTRIGFIFDWNPSLNEHWVFRNGFDRTSVYGDDERLAGQPKCLYAHSTYKDNLDNLTESQVAGIEQYEPTPGNIARGTADAYMWSVYGLGKRGFIEGRVIPPEKVSVIPEVVDGLSGATDDGFPTEKQWELHGYGLDWGFAADPTALVECAIWNRKLYVRELIYEKNLIVSPDPTLPMARSVIGLLRDLKIKPTDTIVADSARPDLNSALRNAGFLVTDAYKPGGSIENGVNLMNQRRWMVCERSRNVQFELENWTWAKDRYGNTLRKPIDKHNHCLVGGTKVRTRRGDVKIKDVIAGDEVLTRRGYRKVIRSWRSGVNKKVFKLKFDNGSYIIGTGNHQVLTLRGFLPIDDIAPGDKVLSLANGSRHSDFWELRSLMETGDGVSSMAGDWDVSGFTVARVTEKKALWRKAREVFDLTVDGEHEFFANGVLVHNCMDAVRYWLTTFVSSGNVLVNGNEFEEHRRQRGIEYADVVWVY